MTHKSIFLIENMTVDCSDYDLLKNVDENFNNIRTADHNSICSKVYYLKLKTYMLSRDLSYFISSYKCNKASYDINDTICISNLTQLMFNLESKRYELQHFYENSNFSRVIFNNLSFSLDEIKNYSLTSKENYVSAFDPSYIQLQDFVISSLWGGGASLTLKYILGDNFIHAQILFPVAIALTSILYQYNEKYHKPVSYLKFLQDSNLYISDKLLALSGEIHQGFSFDHE